MAPTRRDLLKASCALGLGLVLPRCAPLANALDADAPDAGDAGNAGDAPDVADTWTAPDAGTAPDVTEPWHAFQYGVASGDPIETSVVLWTRVTPRPGTPDDEILTVRWEVSRTAEFTELEASGDFRTGASRDYSVKADPGTLTPGTTYYYRFSSQGERSAIGRTRTAPRGSVSQLRFAVLSCASYAHGYFHAYRAVAQQRDLDAVLHLGDYIYEYGNGQYGALRTYDPPHEVVTLSDYRRRHAHYKRDQDLCEAHRQHPFICVWDDHEFADNAWADGAANHNAGEGAWSDRRAAAAQAYFEWMPVREPTNGAIYRALRYGSLVDLLLLDTRIEARAQQVARPDDPALNSADRQLLGAAQEAWLGARLTSSAATWKLLGQQVMMAQLPLLGNLDQWDGYPGARDRFFTLLRANAMQNVVVLTGDIHSSWAMDLCEDPFSESRYNKDTGQGSLAVELVVPGVSSPGFPPVFANALPRFYTQNPHLKAADLTRRGYMVLDVTPARLQAAWFHFADVTSAAPQSASCSFALSTRAGENHLQRDAAPAPSRDDAPPLAP